MNPGGSVVGTSVITLPTQQILRTNQTKYTILITRLSVAVQNFIYFMLVILVRMSHTLPRAYFVVAKVSLTMK